MNSGNNKILNYKVKDKSKAVIPERIKETRIYRGLTQRELGEKIGLTRQAINSYEAGTNVPPLNVLLEISKILDFPINFFYKERVVCENQGEVYFRSRAIPCKAKDMLELKLKYLSTEIVYFIEKYINLPKLNLIEVEYKEEYTINDIINIAKRLREYWGLNDKSVKNLMYVMQENGCIIARLNLNSKKTDGYSKWLSERPYTFLNTEKNAAVRTRFTLAHELGHIILHHNLRDGEDIRRREKEANYFAGEFLFPSEAVVNEISFVSLDALVPIKNKWGISIGAIIRRCLDLELITEERYTTLQKQISKRKWRTFEPLDDIIKCEEPQLFSEAFKLLVDNGIMTKSEIQNSILFSDDELINICCLDPSFFKEEKLSIKPKLEVVK
ncbi:ImmA/IrrE family metallo-endopeptidase [Clostridium sp. WILCCON 0269]|uniref:ImmA/IrrE family metallo-endopeptidase n=1 Tax=Candidatus Clostridium eludens TaxID=3381663 RepID=A0ABW8SLN8_9CLOT